MGTDSEDLTERNDEEDGSLPQRSKRSNRTKMTRIDKRGRKSYDLWLRNSRMLYDYVLVHSTEWPSYVAEWYFADEFPSRSLREESFKYAILSTYSSTKVNCSTKVGGSYNEEQRMWEKDCDCIDIIRFSVPSPNTEDYRLYVDDPYRKIGTYEWKRIIHPGEISRIRYLSFSVLIRRVLPFSDWIVSHGSTNQLSVWDLKRQVNRKVKKTKNRASTPNLVYSSSGFRSLPRRLYPSNNDQLQLFPLSIYVHYTTTHSATVHPDGPRSATPSNTQLNSLSESAESVHPNEVDSTQSLQNSQNSQNTQNTQNSNKQSNSTSNTHIASESSSQLIISLLAASKTCLHIWNLSDLSSRENGTHSLSIDLQPFHPSLSIEDVSFLSGFDRTGGIVGVAGAKGVIMVVNSRTNQLIWKVLRNAFACES